MTTTPVDILLYMGAAVLMVGLIIRFLMWVFKPPKNYVVLRPKTGGYYAGQQSGTESVWCGSLQHAMHFTASEAETVARKLGLAGVVGVPIRVKEVR